MDFSVIIPARYASTRFPGKPLADVMGKPMLQHVYERALRSQAQRVIIATDHSLIAERARQFGAEVCLTSDGHHSGTDRIQEVVEKLHFPPEHIVVNVQGDEPAIPTSIINQVAKNLGENLDADMATLSETITVREQLTNPHVVKVICDKQGMALYFSRACIPWPREAFAQSEADDLPEQYSWQRHIGIYAYRVQFLHRFVRWPVAPIEATESLEQLRALWNGCKIHVDLAKESPPTGVDTPEDLAKLIQQLQHD